MLSIQEGFLLKGKKNCWKVNH